MLFKHLVLSFSILMLSLGAISIQGQEAAPPSDGDAKVEAIHNQLRELKDSMLSAISKKDKAAVLGLLAEDVVVTVQDGSKLVCVRKPEGVADYLDRLLTGPKPGVSEIQIDLKVDEKTILYGDTLGVAFGSSDDRYVLNGGASFDLKTRWTATVVSKDGKWLLAGLHVSSNLFDNPIVVSQQSTLKFALAIAAGIGLVLGLVLGKLMKK